MVMRPCGLLIKDNHLLTMRYRYGGQDRYNLPGGNRDPGEAVAECLVREFAEELGVVVIPIDLVFLAETAVGNREILHLVFSLDAVSGEACLNPLHTQADEIVWQPVAKLPSLPLYPDLGAFLASWCLQDRKLPIYLGKINQPWF